MCALAGFKADPSPSKLNLGVGAYRDEEGQPYVLSAVKKAEMRLVTNPSENKVCASRFVSFCLPEMLGFTLHVQESVSLFEASGGPPLRCGGHAYMHAYASTYCLEDACPS
jgi:hypothetical protein